MTATLRRLALACCLGLIPVSAFGQAPVVGQIPVRDGSMMRVLYLAPPQPTAIVMLLPGGPGIIGLDDAGNIRNGGNFLVRTRQQWLAHGFAALLPDAPDGASLLGQRSKPPYAVAMAGAIDFARARNNVPVWVIGTSQGSTAATNAAAHLAGRVTGAVLTSSVTGRTSAGETLFDAEPGTITVPVLVVANEHDTCRASLPGNTPNIIAALGRSPRKETMLFDSSERRSDPCEAMSPHGYLGIESTVVQRISDWIRSAGGR